MKKLYILSILLLCVNISTKAQVSNDNRIELELKDGYTDEKIMEFGEMGLIMSSRDADPRRSETEWKYEKYDTDLQLAQTKSVILENKLHVEETFTNKKRTHTFFMSRRREFSIVTVDASNFEIIKAEGELPNKTRIKKMSVLGDYVFLQTYVKKNPTIFSINWKTGKINQMPIVLEGFKTKDISLLDFQVLEDANEILMYTKAYTKRKETDIYIFRFNDEGQKVETYSFTKGLEQNIIDLSSSKLNEDENIITGTYSNNSASTSEGIYFCKTSNEKIDFIKFYKFLDLKNFLSYLPEKKQEKIEKKKKKKQNKGKELKFSYQIAAHEIMKIENGYLFLGEAYYPTYRTETYSTTSTVNGVTTTSTQTRQVFDGYQYTHAMLGLFDEEGNLLWDQIFEMKGSYKPFYVKRFISIAEKDENSLKLVFASGKRIISKSIDYEGAVINDSESEDIETSYTGDKVKTSFSNIDYWYDNYFVAYGSQKIKNKAGEAKRKRKVYFVSKIKFE